MYNFVFVNGQALVRQILNFQLLVYFIKEKKCKLHFARKTCFLQRRRINECIVFIYVQNYLNVMPHYVAKLFLLIVRLLVADNKHTFLLLYFYINGTSGCLNFILKGFKLFVFKIYYVKLCKKYRLVKKPIKDSINKLSGFRLKHQYKKWITVTRLCVRKMPFKLIRTN